MRNYLMIGSSPCDEDCAQIGSPRYHELSKLELAQFKAAIIQKLGQPPVGASLIIKDGEVAVSYDTDNEKASDWAFKAESDSPATWEEVNMKAPKLDDDDFAATELIPVPANGRAAVSVPKTCNLADDQLMRSPSCLVQIGNEYMDCSIPGIGSWASVCPACFGAVRGQLGVGRGQRFRKATDGKFYCVEGGRAQERMAVDAEG